MNDEVLMLVDAEGNYYEIPREIVEKHRVSEERKAEIESAEDVSGYSHDTYFIREQIAAYRQAEMREQGGRERMLRSARDTEEVEKEQEVVQSRGMLFGAFVRKLITRTT